MRRRPSLESQYSAAGVTPFNNFCLGRPRSFRPHLLPMDARRAQGGLAALMLRIGCRISGATLGLPP